MEPLVNLVKEILNHRNESRYSNSYVVELKDGRTQKIRIVFSGSYVRLNTKVSTNIGRSWKEICRVCMEMNRESLLVAYVPMKDGVGIEAEVYLLREKMDDKELILYIMTLAKEADMQEYRLSKVIGDRF